MVLDRLWWCSGVSRLRAASSLIAPIRCNTNKKWKHTSTNAALTQIQWDITRLGDVARNTRYETVAETNWRRAMWSKNELRYNRQRTNWIGCNGSSPPAWFGDVLDRPDERKTKVRTVGQKFAKHKETGKMCTRSEIRLVEPKKTELVWAPMNNLLILVNEKRHLLRQLAPLTIGFC